MRSILLGYLLPPTGLALLLARPGLRGYVGLSGVVHGLRLLLGLGWWRRDRRFAAAIVALLGLEALAGLLAALPLHWQWNREYGG